VSLRLHAQFFPAAINRGQRKWLPFFASFVLSLAAVSIAQPQYSKASTFLSSFRLYPPKGINFLSSKGIFFTDFPLICILRF
jgi:hypothetical protein